MWIVFENPFVTKDQYIELSKLIPTFSHNPAGEYVKYLLEEEFDELAGGKENGKEMQEYMKIIALCVVTNRKASGERNT
jgi:hypothetical protein